MIHNLFAYEKPAWAGFAVFAYQTRETSNQQNCFRWDFYFASSSQASEDDKRTEISFWKTEIERKRHGRLSLNFIFSAHTRVPKDAR